MARKAVQLREVPGVAIGLVHNGRLVLSRGYGLANLETGTPVRSDTVFNIFSVTKAFTAAAVMQLAERGQLRLDDRLSRYFPTFPRGNEVTIAQLLSHTSGLKDYAGSSAHLVRVGATPEEIVSLIARLNETFDFDPGTKSRYSNSNFALLGRIIELVSGKSYSRYLEENIFPPARLARTAVDRNTDVVAGRATGYAADPRTPGQFHNYYLDISMPFAAGAMRSTVPDLAAWFTALFEERIVSAASVARMTTIPARLNDGRRAGDVPADPAIAPGSTGYYGLGIRTYSLDGYPAIGPSGSWQHFSSKVTYYPTLATMIIVLANAGGGAGLLEERTARLIFRELEARDALCSE